MDGGMPVSHESPAASPLVSPGGCGVTVYRGEAQPVPSTHILTLENCGSLWPGWRFAPAVVVRVGPRCAQLAAIAKRCPEERENCCSRGRNWLRLSRVLCTMQGMLWASGCVLLWGRDAVVWVAHLGLQSGR